ncbi:hypothetical protein P3L10_009386 [Capsicum annuum]
MSYFNNTFFTFIFIMNLVLLNAWPWTSTFHVFIHNALPENSQPLTLRCQSKDDDLKTNVLNVNDVYDFRFQLHVFGGTLFFCHFYWNNKDLIFDVFNNHISNHCGGMDGDIGRDAGLFECHWRVQNDGFYFAPYNTSNYVKKYAW